MRGPLFTVGASLGFGLAVCAVGVGAGADTEAAVGLGLGAVGAARAALAVEELRRTPDARLRRAFTHALGAALAAALCRLAAPPALEWTALREAVQGFRAYVIVLGLGLAALALWEGRARAEAAPPPEPETSTSRWASRAALLVILGGGLWVNATHLAQRPMPPPSSHHSFMLAPRLAHYFMGWDHRRVVVGHAPQLAMSATYYTIPVHAPLPWTDPPALIAELQEGGRLSQLLGRCDDDYSTCMPHFYGIIGAVAALAPGQGLLPMLVPTGFFLLLLVGLWDLGRLLVSRAAGVAAAAVGLGFPGLFGMARWPESYIGEAALSTIMVVCLVRSRGLTRWAPLVGFAACALVAIRAGEGFSESVGAGLAVAGAFMVTVGAGVVDGVRARRFPWAWAGGLVLVLGLVAATTDWHWVADSLMQIRRGIDEEDMAASWRSPGASARSQLFIRHGLYAWFIVNEYVRPPLLLPVTAGLLGVAVLPGLRLRDRLLLFAWFLIPFVGFSFMLRKAIWYPIPMLPPLAALAGVGLALIPYRRVRIAALVVAAALGLHQLGTLSFPASGLGFPARWVQPFDPKSVKVRWVEMLGLRDDRGERLTADAKRLLAALDATHPPGEGLIYVAAYTPWGTDTLSANRLGYFLTLSRPDLAVVELSVPRHVQAPAYAGLKPETFSYLVCIAENGAFTDCATELARPAKSDTPAALPAFTGRLLERSTGSLPGAPQVHVLGDPP